jgi:hypothetical protein
MIVDAQYQTSGLSSRYLGNPLIEALPSPLTQAQLLRELSSQPKVDLSLSRQQTLPLRVGDVDSLDELYVPFQEGITFAEDLDRLLRKSYSNRNPLNISSATRLHTSAKDLMATSNSGSTTEGMLLLTGPSGYGKSRLCRAVLNRFPAAIRHHQYQGVPFNYTQLVWLSVDAPIGESVKGLLLRMLTQLDIAVGIHNTPQAYAPIHASSAVDKLIYVFSQAAMTYQLGVLHIDDIQRMAESRAGKNRGLNLIIQLANVVRCPILFSGTSAAMELVSASLEATRRASSAGAFLLELPGSSKDINFVRLVKFALRYQWLDQPLAASEDVYEKIFLLSSGVTSVVMLLIKEAQVHALRQSKSSLDLSDFDYVYKNRMQPLHSALRMIRERGIKGLEEYERELKSNSLESLRTSRNFG